MSLKEKIYNDLKQAMVDKDEKLLSVLRMLKTAILNKEISLRKGEDVSLDDNQTTEVIVSEAKKRKDSVTEYEKGNREDLANKEKEELEILNKYLPEQLEEKEIEKIVKETIAELGEVSMSDFGRIMGQLMPKLKGRADGNKVTEILKKSLK